MAGAFKKRGAKVVVVSGPVEISYPAGVKVVPVTTALEMLAAAKREARSARVVVGAAAVGDWRFAKAASKKLKRKPGPLNLTLLPNPDIIKALALRRPKGQVVVGFALETHAAVKFARRKLEAKGLDAVVVNGPKSLAGEFSDAALVEKDSVTPLNARSKSAAAAKLVRAIERILK